MAKAIEPERMYVARHESWGYAGASFGYDPATPQQWVDEKSTWVKGHYEIVSVDVVPANQ